MSNTKKEYTQIISELSSMVSKLIIAAMDNEENSAIAHHTGEAVAHIEALISIFTDMNKQELKTLTLMELSKSESAEEVKSETEADSFEMEVNGLPTEIYSIGDPTETEYLPFDDSSVEVLDYENIKLYAVAIANLATGENKIKTIQASNDFDAVALAVDGNDGLTLYEDTDKNLDALLKYYFEGELLVSRPICLTMGREIL